MMRCVVGGVKECGESVGGVWEGVEKCDGRGVGGVEECGGRDGGEFGRGGVGGR